MFSRTDGQAFRPDSELDVLLLGHQEAKFIALALGITMHVTFCFALIILHT